MSSSSSTQQDIFKEFGNRFVLFPIKYASVWGFYKKAVSAFWTPEEIDLSKDYSDWLKLSEGEQHFVQNILAFFAGSDGIVNENLSVRFMNEIPVQEVKSFYGFQIAMENIHCVTGNTRILTRKGYLPIGDLEGKMVDVWNGEQWTENVTVFKTHDAAPVMTVSLSNGMFLQCTPNHEWLVEEGKRIATSDLVVGQKLADFTYPTDGVVNVDELLFSNCREHGELVFTNPENDVAPYNPIRFNCRPRDFVPLNYTRATQIDWLHGVLRMAKTNKEAAFIYHPDQEVLHNVQLMLTMLNVPSTMGENALIFLPVDIARGTGIIDMPSEESSAFKAKINGVVVAHIEAGEKTAPMYCFEERVKHQGVFNGILTGQSETYSLLLDTYIKDSETKERLLNGIETIPAVKKKAEWALKWITNEAASFAKRLVAFACVEGIFFSGAFCAIFWLKERGVMPGLCLSNEFISRDESLHTEFAVHLYGLLGSNNALDQDTIHEIIRECVLIEDEFITESIPCNLLGMNNGLMSQYIRFVADRLAVQLGVDAVYGAMNPFPFMERISLSNKTNFFEHTRQSEYSKARIGDDKTANEFALDADF